MKQRQRIILLLDMDCFYAQCETVRLGLPQSLPLCLIQWNSVLAVNYPAREKFDIRRMDSLQVVREKSLKRQTDSSVSESNDDNDSSSSSEKKNNDGVEEGCVCIHLPVMKVNDINNNSSQNNTQQQHDNEQQQDYNNNDDDDDNLNNTISAYNTEFNQPSHIQRNMYLSERNVMRSPSEGKANLDRYRLASARIFGLIDDTLGELLSGIKTADNDCDGHDGAEENKGHTKSGYVLERASIDELFIDVTEFCYDILERGRLKKKNKRKSEECCKEKKVGGGDDGVEAEAEAAADNDDTKQIKREEFQRNCLIDSIASLKESVVCHQNRIPPSYIQQHHHNDNDDDDDDAKALQIGCHIAHTIRRIVFQTLGFTLSSGISTSKLVAKLAASYGKPNGQAVIYPEAIPYVMDETEIRKARMLGGKLGKKVVSLLPPEQLATVDDKKKATMGCVARLLTLDDLVSGLGEENGRWVFDACRGIEHEEVKSTLKVLPKSITAFKSFPKVSYPELEKWTALLARDVMKRVQLDNARNNRIPRAVTVGYTMKPGGSWIGKTFRLPFPTDREFDSRVQRLVDNTRKILTERGEKSFIRIGYSAIDFVVRPKTGIDSFFAQQQEKKNTTPSRRQRDGVGSSSSTPTHPKDTNNIESTRARLNARLKHDQQQKEECGIQGWLAKVDSSAEVSTKAREVAEEETTSPNRDTNLKQSSQTADGAESIAFEEGSSANIATISEEINQNILSDEELARRLQSTYDDEAARENSSSIIDERSSNNDCDGDRAITRRYQSATDATNDDMDKRDRAIALELQSKYDREHSILSDVERFSGISKRKGTSPKNQRGATKKNRIDNFFSKR